MSGPLLGVDVGTSSTEDARARPDGEIVATAQRDHDLSPPRPGRAEHDADRTRIVGTVEPEEENCGVYDELYGVYRELYPATREQAHRLGGLQKGGVGVV